jgi:hypothetical protein
MRPERSRELLLSREEAASSLERRQPPKKSSLATIYTADLSRYSRGVLRLEREILRRLSPQSCGLGGFDDDEWD